MPPRLNAFPLLSFSTLKPRIPNIAPLARLPCRPASQYPFNGGRRPQYNRFDRARQIRYLWQTSPLFRSSVLIISGVSGVFYVYNLETVSVSGRRRFNCISEEWEKRQSRGAFRQVMRQYRDQILPPYHPESRLVEQVVKRLLPASGLGSEGWEVKVIEDPRQKNAFVMPGGKVFVFSGILPICKDEEGLAAVLGHEISHNLAHHSAEKMSRFFFLIAAVHIAGLFFGIDSQVTSYFLDFVVERPGSRQMESEADQLGLLMMAKSCYDPQKAVEFWQRMAKAEEYATPQWASTHPSSKNRIRAIQNWLPAAEQIRQKSGCKTTGGLMKDFNRTFRVDPPGTRRGPAIAQHPVAPARSDDDDGYFF